MQCALLSKASTAPAVYAKLPMFLNFKNFLFSWAISKPLKNPGNLKKQLKHNKSSGHLIGIFTAQFQELQIGKIDDKARNLLNSLNFKDGRKILKCQKNPILMPYLGCNLVLCQVFAHLTFIINYELNNSFCLACSPFLPNQLSLQLRKEAIKNSNSQGS